MYSIKKLQNNIGNDLETQNKLKTFISTNNIIF